MAVDTITNDESGFLGVFLFIKVVLKTTYMFLLSFIVPNLNNVAICWRPLYAGIVAVTIPMGEYEISLSRRELVRTQRDLKVLS